MAMTLYVFCCVLLVIVLPTRCAPRSKNSKNIPQTVYDQKQTGDYNIQLHLKDFQIIALLGDDSLGSLDYDYNYDYADFTVKPPQATSSPSPPTPTARPPTTQTPQKPLSTLKPANHPYPILLPSSILPPKDQATIIQSTTPAKPQENSSKHPESLLGNISNEVTDQKSTSAAGESTEKIDLASSTTQKAAQEANSPGKIKVQIIEAPVNAGSVPGEETGEQSVEGSGATQSGSSNTRRCSSGFARDKKGRCRRIRRPATPQLPYGFSRLATNLASRFRYASSDSTQISSESTEK